MASEILRAPETKIGLPVHVQAVAESITNAANSQAKESIDHALQSFSSIQDNNIELLSFLGKSAVQSAGHADDPLKYLTSQYSIGKEQSSDRPYGVLFNLRNQNLHFHQGVASFLKSGIQESLAGLKIGGNPKLARPLIPVPLDELVSTEKLKNPDRTQLQISLQVMDEMFSTLKNLQSGLSDLRFNIMRTVRA